MPSNSQENSLFEFLTQPKFKGWRHLLFLMAIVPIAMSQTFYVFGSHTAIPTATIYFFGTGFALIVIAIVYLNRYYLVPRLLSKGKYFDYFIVMLLAVLGFVLVKYLVEYRIFSQIGVTRPFTGVTLLDGLSNLTVYTICITSGSLTLLFKQWREDHAEIEGLENIRLKKSIDDIKNRIRPKFLYATLAYASEQAKSDPGQTSDTLLRLSELLRYQLYDCTRDKVLLATDIEFIRNYLLLEQQNANNEFSFTVSVTGDPNLFVPPALFLPWIEEIIRNNPRGLWVVFDISSCLIEFTCQVSGIDLGSCDFQKTTQRPELLYGDDLEVFKSANSIVLKLNLC